MSKVEKFSEPPLEQDWHAVLTYELGELVEDGIIDFDSSEYDFDCYDSEQRQRLWQLFQTRFYFREIGIIPYRRWHMRLIGTLNEIMPKYKPLYEYIDEGNQPLAVESIYNKSRSISSDFPQTILSGNEDYASFGNDFEHEEIRLGDYIEKMKDTFTLRTVDSMILDELEPLFSSLITVNMNAW